MEISIKDQIVQEVKNKIEILHTKEDSNLLDFAKTLIDTLRSHNIDENNSEWLIKDVSSELLDYYKKAKDIKEDKLEMIIRVFEVSLRSIEELTYLKKYSTLTKKIETNIKKLIDRLWEMEDLDEIRKVFLGDLQETYISFDIPIDDFNIILTDIYVRLKIDYLILPASKKKDLIVELLEFNAVNINVEKQFYTIRKGIRTASTYSFEDLQEDIAKVINILKDADIQDNVKYFLLMDTVDIFAKYRSGASLEELKVFVAKQLGKLSEMELSREESIKVLKVLDLIMDVYRPKEG
jgi:hypothetical protein